MPLERIYPEQALVPRTHRGHAKTEEIIIVLNWSNIWEKILHGETKLKKICIYFSFVNKCFLLLSPNQKETLKIDNKPFPWLKVINFSIVRRTSSAYHHQISIILFQFINITIRNISAITRALIHISYIRKLRLLFVISPVLFGLYLCLQHFRDEGYLYSNTGIF